MIAIEPVFYASVAAFVLTVAFVWIIFTIDDEN